VGARAPASSLNEEIVREHRETERQKMHEILDEYLLFCRQMGVLILLPYLLPHFSVFFFFLKTSFDR
jgi:hypothetical protein